MAKAQIEGGNAPGLWASVVLSGVASIISVNFIHPIELVKTRIQVTGLSVTVTVRRLIHSEGHRALYKGIQAAWLREGSYTALKMGMYAPVRDFIAGFDGSGRSATPGEMFVAGCVTGALGSATSNPFDVLKTMQMANEGVNAPSLPSLARKLVSEEGAGGLYRGILANVSRATVNNGVKFAAYDISKQSVQDLIGWERDDSRNYLLSSMISSFCMAVAIAPLDMMRTKLMNQPVDGKAIKNQQVYKGFYDCFTRIMKKHGPLAFYRGFVPLYTRMLPATILQLGIFELLLTFAGYESI